MSKTLLVTIGIFLLLLVAGYFYINKDDSSDSVENKTTQTPQKSAKTEYPNSQNSLDLSNKNLKKISNDVFTKTNLETLNISNNNLEGALPSEIKNLKKLKTLNASNNKMTGIPAEIGQLTNLEILDFSNNLLTGLPYELSNLTKLKILNLSGNNYSKQDLEIIKKGLTQTTQIIL